MDIREVDLNLLVVLDAMARHRSVNRAAEAIGLSQPATSAALARLRLLFGDALFVRTGSAMKPTPRALELADPVHRVVETIAIEVLQAAAFEPSRAERTFTVLTPDIGEVTFIPPILKRLQSEAPLITLRALSMPRGAASEALGSGTADLAVGFFPDLKKSGIYQQRLFKTSYQCIACASYKAIAARLTMKEFRAARHVIVRPDGREHVVDRFLEEKGHSRRVVLEVSHFMSLLAILPGSDLIATVPDDIAAAVGRHIPIRTLELPFRPPVIEVQQSWHRRMQQDPAHKWLREMFYELHRRP